MRKRFNYFSIVNNFNFLFFVICIFFYIKYKFLDPIEINKFIDYKTFLYGAALSIESMFFNQFLNKKFNPFIFILIASTFVFYQLRILTLSYFNYSSVITRNSSEVLLNETLLFIIGINFFIFLGIYLSTKYFSCREIKFLNKNNFAYERIGNYLFILILLTVFAGFFFYKLDNKFILYPFLRFFNPIYFIFAGFSCIAFYKKINKNKTIIKYNIFFALIIIVSLFNSLLLTLHGSRAGIFSLFEFLLIIYLVYDQKDEFKLIHILYWILSIALLSFFFILATKIRIKSYGFNFVEIKNFEFYCEIFKNSQNTVKEYFAMVADRIGYLDYATDLISNKKKYELIFNFKFYLKSIIDNLTPGFDIYNIPQISQSIQFIYYNLGYPSKSFLAVTTYHTDELTFYGEIFNLTGYYSFIVAFLVGVFFQYLYNCTHFSRENLSNFIAKVFLLYTFYLLLASFGLDSFIYQTTYIALVFFIFILFMTKRDA